MRQNQCTLYTRKPIRRGYNDEQVYVIRFFGEIIDPARPDGFDEAKQGVIDSFAVEDVFLGQSQGEASIEQTLSEQDLQALAGFLGSIDDATKTWDSDAERFLQKLR